MIDKKKTVKIFYDNLGSIFKAEGKIIEDNDREILIHDNKDGLMSIPRNRIIKIMFTEGR